MSEETHTPERYTTVLLGDAEVPVCLACGLVVGVETLHDNRCYGEEVNRRGEAAAQMMWEERVAEGEYDDER